MDPNLWLINDSGCGFSCHVECALRHGRVHLDGCYSCASYNKFSSIIGCWKEQLKVALDRNRVDVMCYRISLSYRLLNGTSKFRELHAASDVQPLCRLAVKKAEELLSSVSNLNGRPDDSRLKSIQKRIQLGSCSRAGDVQHETSTLRDLNEEYREADMKPSTVPPSTSNVSGGLDDAFENIVKTICELEHNSFVTEQLRMKFLKWFNIKAKEHEHRIVRTFVQTMIEDLKLLAEQLIDTFSAIIFSTKP